MARGNYEHFSWIYDEKNGWGGKGSGRGSRAEFNRNYIMFLNNYLKENKIKRVLDIGCGDWQFSQFVNWGDAEYVGIDVVKSVIEKNKANFEKGNVTFINSQVHDLQDLNFDLVLNKDCFPHLSFEEILKIMEKIKHIPHKLFTIDTHSEDKNKDTIIGSYRKLRLDIEPFNLKGTYLDLYGRDCKKTFVIK